jgi:putative hydrolase of the HAD superfamily
MPIQTVIFDIGRTLVPFSFDPIRPQLESCKAEARALIERIEVGGIAPAEFQAAMCALTGVEATRFPAWWNSIFELEPRWLVPPAWLSTLRKSHRLGLMSNTNAPHFDYLAQLYPQLTEFDFRITSYEAGAEKPSPRIYAAAEAQAGCGPEAILYFDDIPEFVAAARQRGWRAEVFTGAEALAQALETHGIHLDPRASAAASRANTSPLPPLS